MLKTKYFFKNNHAVILSGKVQSAVIALMFLLILSGCTIKHNYIWKEYPIKEGQTFSDEQLATAGTISIINGNSNEDVIDIGHINLHHYYSSRKQLSESIVSQLTHELEKRKVKVLDGSTKSLLIQVTDNKLVQGFWVFRAYMDVSVKAGDKPIRNFKISYKTGGTVPHAYDGAVTIAVTEILNDSDIVNYLHN